ncbi:Gfo/Idh/MocA family protein [Pelagicoccus mobilis]|uniref:Gfo/Idh/MocA family oxidoreductase n=1 Tax=Pelagicoccus mobilis TaxID=415221 RepID=A0A934VUF0_9BACT|nr:Gfo/Idh/MocA family oxidoreductase [Pelagicoccus mobilis]MBK1880474.1 Gfo/Idh/MocA family oxidoreductase [Pelagicoccus mobilis]
MSEYKKLKVGIVGLGGIFKLHEQAIAACGDVELVAVCDLDQAKVDEISERVEAVGYTDLDAMMAEARPDVVVISTDTASHAALTCRVAELGARAVHCEKPMAVHPVDAWKMVDVCERTGTLLTINHQRRMGDLAFVRTAIESGLIGDLCELYGYCAGDFLSDGTHLIDSLMGLSGDPKIETIKAGLDLSNLEKRYGHIKEAGAFAVLDSKEKIRLSLFTGTFAERRVYQEYLIVGSRGMLWRSGDRANPHNWFICDGQLGDREVKTNDSLWYNMPLPAGARGGPWRPLEVPEDVDAGKAVYQGIVDSLRSGVEHPLGGRRTLTVQRLIAGIYQSGLSQKGLRFEDAVAIDRFPLMNEELLKEKGVTV